jgi:hypothetical protein
VNHSARAKDADLAKIAAAITLQDAQHFSPSWGLVPSTVIAVPKGHTVPIAAHIAVIDKPNLADALGYHTDDGGIYDGFIYVNPVLDNGGTILGDPAHPSLPCLASVASHEVLELRGDPTCNRWIDCGQEITEQDGTTFSEVADEVCDPCEEDGYAVHVVVGGVPAVVVVSNFVLPAFFDQLAPAHAKRDWLGRLHGPFMMDAGGYMAVRDGAGQETQVFGDRVPEWKRELKRAQSLRQARRLRKLASIQAGAGI